MTEVPLRRGPYFEQRVRNLVACPMCGALIGQMCRLGDGSPVQRNHLRRIEAYWRLHQRQPLP